MPQQEAAAPGGQASCCTAGCELRSTHMRSCFATRPSLSLSMHCITCSQEGQAGAPGQAGRPCCQGRMAAELCHADRQRKAAAAAASSAAAVRCCSSRRCRRCCSSCLLPLLPPQQRLPSAASASLTTHPPGSPTAGPPGSPCARPPSGCAPGRRAARRRLHAWAGKGSRHAATGWHCCAR